VSKQRTNLAGFVLPLTATKVFKPPDSLTLWDFRCGRISLDGRLSTIPTSFLLSDYVLRCSNMYFMRPCNGFDNDALAKWLLNNETSTETKYVEMTLDTCLSDSKYHHDFMELFTKLSEQAKKVI
jgi:hypothetical protein